MLIYITIYISMALILTLVTSDVKKKNSTGVK